MLKDAAHCRVIACNASYPMVNRGQSCRSSKLITHLHLVSMLSVSGNLPIGLRLHGAVLGHNDKWASVASPDFILKTVIY